MEFGDGFQLGRWEVGIDHGLGGLVDGTGDSESEEELTRSHFCSRRTLRNRHRVALDGWGRRREAEYVDGSNGLTMEKKLE